MPGHLNLMSPPSLPGGTSSSKRRPSPLPPGADDVLGGLTRLTGLGSTLPSGERIRSPLLGGGLPNTLETGKPPCGAQRLLASGVAVEPGQAVFGDSGAVSSSTVGPKNRHARVHVPGRGERTHASVCHAATHI